MIAIHNDLRQHLFHYRWVAYCQEKNIPYKLVDCYANDIIYQLRGCRALFFHFHQCSPKDIIMARPLLNSLEQAGIPVFPDFRTAWHFDDKLGQKYLLEAIGAPLAPSWVFYNKKEALDWVQTISFPKVCKLRGGAGSQNVWLIKSRAEARKIVDKAFGRGISVYNSVGNFKERLKNFKTGRASVAELLKGLGRLIIKPRFAKIIGTARDYVLFQDYIKNDGSDVRVIIVGDKAFGLMRYVRDNDFRASGSGKIDYNEKLIPEKAIKIAFDTTSKLNSQCVVFDFVLDMDVNPWIVEISYGFANKAYDLCPGYWDKELNWHPGHFDPYGWMIEELLNKISS